jgi:predicted ester cyclase
VIVQTVPTPGDVLDRVLDKGIVIDAWVRVALAGIDLVRVEARVVVASIETYTRYAGELAPDASPAAPPQRSGRSRRPPAMNIAHLLRTALRAWNGRRATGYASLLGDHYVGETHAVPVTLRGRTAARRAMRMKLALFPDLRFDVDDVLAAGDDALVSWTASGTCGGRRLRVGGCTVARLHDGKIEHTWCYWDTPDMLAPLRVVRDGAHTLHRLAQTP